MTEDNRRTHVVAELAKARGRWQAARELLRPGLRDEAASNLYFAVYHHACAALLADGVEATSHRGLQSLVSLHLVRAGHLSAKSGRWLVALHGLCNQADYNWHFRLDADGAAEQRERAEQLAGELDAFLARRGLPVLAAVGESRT
jgi:uncharacterized protein (UPF0332 family)